MLRRLPTGQAVALEHEVIPAWMAEGLFGFAHHGAFIDIGTPASLAEAGHFFQTLGR